MREYIKSFMCEFDFPEEAHKELINVYDIIQKNGIWELLSGYINEYEATDTLDWDAASLKIIEVSKEKGISEYSVNMVYLICLTKHVRVLYGQQGKRSFKKA